MRALGPPGVCGRYLTPLLEGGWCGQHCRSARAAAFNPTCRAEHQEDVPGPRCQTHGLVCGAVMRRPWLQGMEERRKYARKMGPGGYEEAYSQQCRVKLHP